MKSQLSRQQSNDVSNALEKFKHEDLISMANSIKELIIHAAVTMPDDNAKMGMLKEDILTSKLGADLLDMISGLIYDPSNK